MFPQLLQSHIGECSRDVIGSKYPRPADCSPITYEASGGSKRSLGPSVLSVLFSPLPPLLAVTRHLSLSPPPARALYDRVGEAEGDLSFKKDDILFVDESLPKGSFGTWMAWQLDENAQKIQRGQIPSKYMWVENVSLTHTHRVPPV